ncbi:hypothetical protein [Glycomyces buryatensis]|uniref:Uncharacterized protein n=1 Tax=Glycomyces buryatensis TaxID=2570927 RepID=A0A4S8PSX3_9ACTN|nr:hypothetical protein [Glycomyces buryatensis]THV34388.1 hypothetical protein FAB82_24350 [Glycomyces buryatensis]
MAQSKSNQPKQETTQRGFTSHDDTDAYPKAAYCDRDGRRYTTPAFTGRFDEPDVCRKGHSPDLEPAGNRALLDVFICTNARADGAGVLLLDGEVLAAGDGRYQLEIDPGPHRLEVQGYDASSTNFEAAAGERVCYSTGHSVAVRRQVDFRTELYRVRGPEGFLPVLSVKSANVSGVGCLMAVAGLPLLFIGGIVGGFVPNPWQSILFVMAFVGAVILVTGSTMGITTTRRLHKRANEMRLEIERIPAPVPGGYTGTAVAFPSAADAREWAKGRRVGGVLLVFDLFLYRLSRAPRQPAEYTGIGETLALSHAGSLKLWIDGAEAPCDWASWYYPLAPGEHRFAVDYGDGDASHEFTVKVTDHNDMTVVQVPVQVFRLWNTYANAGEALEPRVTHAVTRKAQSTLGKLNQNPSTNDEWVPGRYWPMNAK